MKIKTNLRAGAKSGTVASGNKKSSGAEAPEVETVSPVVYTSRCSGV